MSKARTNADNVAGDISAVTVSDGLVGGGTSGSVNVALPAVSGNNAKYLSTDGTTASWATLTVPTGDSDQIVIPVQVFS